MAEMNKHRFTPNRMKNMHDKNCTKENVLPLKYYKLAQLFNEYTVLQESSIMS